MLKSDNKVPINPFNEKYSSLIRPIKIFLPPRRITKDGEGEYSDFVGRERLMEKLYIWLSAEKTESGCSYLVTGFRGMGKTTLVKRVVDRLTREIDKNQEPFWGLFVMIPLLLGGLFYVLYTGSLWSVILFPVLFVLYVIAAFFVHFRIKNHYTHITKKRRRHYPNSRLFADVHTDRMARGRSDGESRKLFRNIKVSINLGHEILQERHILGLIATSVRDAYKEFYKSFKPHVLNKALFAIIVSLFGLGSLYLMEDAVNVREIKKYADLTEFKKERNSEPYLVIKGSHEDSWFSRSLYNVERIAWKAFHYENNSNDDLDKCFSYIMHFVLFLMVVSLYWWLLKKILYCIPKYSAPQRVLKRLDSLAERIVATTDIETGGSASLDKSVFSVALVNHRKRKSIPIADIREIETELADIINLIKNDCPASYSASFIIVFDEMDKIDPEMMAQPSQGGDARVHRFSKGFSGWHGFTGKASKCVETPGEY